jgi:hypothetical protein
MTHSHSSLIKFVKWCNARNFVMVMILSVLHIGLAYMHTRGSGRADFLSRLIELC